MASNTAIALAAYPRAWIVHRALELRGDSTPERNRPDPAGIDEILFSEDDLWRDPTRIVHDTRSVVWLGRGRRGELGRFLDGHPPTKDEAVRVTKHESDRFELEATLARPAMVMLADVYYPGWTLTIDGHNAPIERANRMMRAASVEQGEHTLVFTYRPGSFRVGLVLSRLALAALVPFGFPALRLPTGGLGLAGRGDV